ncbi:MAG: hypothetical protein AB8G15_03160 [Saprospiraceae bacterium]
MAKQYEAWVIQLIDDLWNICYPGVPRQGNATKSKCESLLLQIDHHLSLQSLFNYANERSSPPSDASLNIMSYYILREWKIQDPTQFANLELDFTTDQLHRNEIAKGDYLKFYRQIKSKETPEKSLAPPVKTDTKFPEMGPIPHVLPRQLSKQVYAVAIACALSVFGLLGFMVHKYQVTERAISKLVADQPEIIISLNDLRGISSLHVFMILLLLFVILYTPFGGKQTGVIPSSLVQRALRQFNRAWIAIWISWFLLYTWMSFAWWQEIHYLENNAYVQYLHFHTLAWAIADIFNILSTIFVFYLFLVMDMERLSEDQSPREKGKFQRSLMRILGISTLILLFSITDRFVDFGNWDDKIGPLLLSLLTAISLMYFFGRLDSHFFKAKREALAPLYLYAGIQVVWVELSAASNMIYAIFFAALLLKLYLFLVVKHWLQNGNFAEYFRRMFRLQDHA